MKFRLRGSAGPGPFCVIPARFTCVNEMNGATVDQRAQGQSCEARGNQGFFDFRERQRIVEKPKASKDSDGA